MIFLSLKNCFYPAHFPIHYVPCRTEFVSSTVSPRDGTYCYEMTGCVPVVNVGEMGVRLCQFYSFKLLMTF